MSGVDRGQHSTGNDPPFQENRRRGRFLRFLGYPSGRKAVWLVLGLWIALVAGISAANLPGKFTDAEDNQSSSYLPESAESTKALSITEELNKGDQAPTVVVYRRDGGLSAADRKHIEEDVARLNQATAAFPNTTPFGNPSDPRSPVPYQLSADGTTALVANQITGTGQSDAILDPVERYRDLVSDPGGGLEVKVAGPAGLSADAIKVFEGINTTLVFAALSLVVVLLILIYRSPIFWLLPLFAVVVAETVARGLGWALTELGVTVNSQSSAIMSILVIGAGTDYALLLVARYREELHRYEDKHDAMRVALRRAGPTIFASGLTVCIALLSLTMASVNGTSGLGPIGALGIAVAIAVMLGFLPGLLVVAGRGWFWPFIPRYGTAMADETHGAWRRIGQRVAARPVAVSLGTLAVLGAMSLGLFTFNTDLTQTDAFRDDVESVQGQDLIAQAFPGGQAAPTDVVIPGRASAAEVKAVARAAADVPGVAQVPTRPVAQGEAGTQLAAFLDYDAYSTDAFDVVPRLREAVRDVKPGVLVGGPSAIEYDLRQATVADTELLVPVVLTIVLVILAVLLRSLAASVLLVLTVVLSFAAALGFSAWVFDVVFDYPGSDPSLLLYSFVFLVALGVDYNIFLMARVREEAMRHGTREGMLRGLAVTGAVITSAGVVLAGTFAVLGVLPLVFLTEIGFVIGFGVLLDTFLVRSVLVPAVTFLIGPRIWAPSQLARTDGGRREPTTPVTASTP